MAVGAFLEPLVVIVLLFGGAWLNRNKDYDFWQRTQGWSGQPSISNKKSDEPHLLYSKPRISSSSSSSDGNRSPKSSPPLAFCESPALRRRRFQIFSYRRYVTTPNTAVFKDRLLSRVLRKFPFLVEAWYWALIYWVYQIGRALTALTIVEGTVGVARTHALEVIAWEQKLHIFWEVPFQRWFLARPAVLHWINRVYSFIHIPGTIFFLVALFYLTNTRKRTSSAVTGNPRFSIVESIAAGPALYEARRRTMAMCNLIAFFVFTLWPCMPPRLLSDPDYHGPNAETAKSYGFVDTVHSQSGESSVWTTNKFCNQYAAMPSLHFGYALLIGLTITTLPIKDPRGGSWKRIALAAAGLSYPALILTAIVATANHFILDAVAGALVCAVAWYANGVLLNLCIIEDHFLWLVRIHKPDDYTDADPFDTDFHSSSLLGDDV